MTNAALLPVINESLFTKFNQFYFKRDNSIKRVIVEAMPGFYNRSNKNAVLDDNSPCIEYNMIYNENTHHYRIV